MPWIEMRGKQHRVYWYGQPAAKKDKTYEQFGERDQAKQFKRLGARPRSRPARVLIAS